MNAMELQNLMTEHSQSAATLVLVSVSSALLLYYMFTREKDRYPAGPRALPFIGNIHQIAVAGGMDTFLEAYRKIYGNIFTIEFGGYKRVVVSGYDNFYKLLVKNADHTSTRCPDSLGPYVVEVVSREPGMIWAPSPYWKTLRSFALSTLREDGMGKTAMEPQVIEEIEKYISHFVEPNHGKSVDISHSIAQASCNIISQLLYSRRFDYDDEEFNMMISMINEQLELGLVIMTTSNIPFVSLFTRRQIAREKELIAKQQPIMMSYIEAVKKELDPDHPRNLIGRFLVHSQKEGGEASYACYAETNAKVLGIQLYIAGTETTSTALRWALLYMCLNPDVQHKVQSEIDEQIGQDRIVTNKDRLNMPYTEAVLLETLRISNITPTGLPHTLEKAVEVDGKIIPAGADLLLNFASLMYDETVFEDPHTFKPNRYLQGDVAMKKQRTAPFGLGRRACLGESLAKMEFFMFFVTFLQRYNVRLPDGSTTTAEAGSNPIVRQPKVYNIIFDPR